MMRQGQTARAAWIAVLLLSSGTAAFAQTEKKGAGAKSGGSPSREAVLVLVNGKKITETDLDRFLTTRRVSEEKRAAERDRFIDQLIDSRLIQQFLDSRDTKASKKELDEQVNRIREAARQRGSDPDKVLAELGYTPQTLRDEFALPIAWQHHIDRTITPERLKEFFEKHRSEYDGTQVRASRILIKPESPDEADWKAAEQKLEKLRADIVSKKLTFAQAAREHSQAPSKDQGGDVGEFPFLGKMPAKFSREAFKLEVGEISEPFQSPYGMELCLVTDRHPGDLSLEDVRDIVLTDLSQEIWKQTLAEMRKTAKIEWKVERQAQRDTGKPE
ncbi:MAG: peptidylprolyl isomerase [Planctomycetes bacterium]|nr:peptidylprolyl isomerase [Planctomycetota bacterium]